MSVIHSAMQTVDMDGIRAENWGDHNGASLYFSRVKEHNDRAGENDHCGEGKVEGFYIGSGLLGDGGRGVC